MRHKAFVVWASTLAVGCVGGRFHHPPAAMMMHPGPGVDGPGPGVLGGEPMRRFAVTQSQVWFSGPEGVQIAWESGGPGMFSPPQVTAPGRYNFAQGSLYRLKLSDIPGRAGVELYPTMEIAPSSPKTDAYLAHSPIPVGFTDEDFDQVLGGNYVTKVVYLPDPEHQELALAGVETLVSTRLEPGVDPIVEADRRGTILAVVRVGTIDLEAPGSGAAVGMIGDGAIMSAGGMMDGGVVMGPCCAEGTCVEGSCPRLAAAVAPPWGMPMSGTPIGLPGPPHIPLGGPAGLQRHTMHNKTRVYVPGPTEKFDVTVKHQPGIRVPEPVDQVYITEKNVFRPHE